jgi:uncharacterized BrkB/YihY/UPF0761 family membrane protein
MPPRSKYRYIGFAISIGMVTVATVVFEFLPQVDRPPRGHLLIGGVFALYLVIAVPYGLYKIRKANKANP